MSLKFKGFQGPQGFGGGAGGDTGPIGELGPQGITGVKGSDGLNGVTGPTGATGVAGIDGFVGATGSPGILGINGPPGATGFQGNTGAPGVPGTDGSNGSPGADGSDGAQGPQGDVGSSAGGISGYVWFKSGSVSFTVTSSAFPIPMGTDDFNWPGGTPTDGGTIDHTSDLTGHVFINQTGNNSLFSLDYAIACGSETETFAFHIRPGNSASFHTISKTVLLSACVADPSQGSRRGACFSLSGRINSNNSIQNFWASNGSVGVQRYSYGIYHLGTV